MSTITKQIQLPQIRYSCYSKTNREGEQFIPEHVFGYTLSGSTEIYVDGKTYHFKEGEYRLFKKNQLAKYTKVPPAGGEYRSVSIYLDQETLRSFCEAHNVKPGKQYKGDGILQVTSNQLLDNYFTSLSPYIHGTGEFNKSVMRLKLQEAILILLQTDPALKDLLFDFTEPGKIDLEAYMNQHYKFNVDISRFAYLTGRSLATFKRDFEKVFHTTPNKWLQQKRLDDAYYLLKEKGWKSSDVYLEVGFKDFSHFSFAFKKAYGLAPSRV